MSAAIVIPFRDRGLDPLRRANLGRVLDWWRGSPWPVYVVSDGREGDAQFNRSAAYNRGAELASRTGSEVLIYTESDMLLDFAQVRIAVDMAKEPGMVVPFTEYRYLDPASSEAVRAGAHPASVEPERVKGNGSSIGAVNVVSRETLALVGGYAERTEGNWFDDDIMRHAFDHCAAPTRWVHGPATHLYHLPGWKGSHLTPEDKAATARNKALWHKVRTLTEPDEIRAALHSC